MKISIVEVGRVPAAFQSRFDPFPTMFRAMFEEAGQSFAFETIHVLDGQSLPEPGNLDGIVITGSPAGVYEDHAWLEPLRGFIREAYAAETPMVGICFGHQIMADALGGVVEKSAKGWGLGRHSYDVVARPVFFETAPERLNLLCSHQDQVIVAPPEAEVILASEFTPNAGFAYRSGKAISFQPHPEFSDEFTRALIDLRRDHVAAPELEKAMDSLTAPSDSGLVRGYIAHFMRLAARRQ
ncbi:type 1 glutamine amidotransferase [Devosia faecipullorum]|uniref:type 1 glutamine amidotransferase n=1 Tax=Devosia faecipullorum TaxID=2755039 RepID=UPI00187B8B66|nr:type 1 glutamine amidotransferase [Devosia faecipullorum]MBE7733249.1 type 1 glutamine amidotransferase [Devosia faecipullorum]